MWDSPPSFPLGFSLRRGDFPSILGAPPASIAISLHAKSTIKKFSSWCVYRHWEQHWVYAGFAQRMAQCVSFRAKDANISALFIGFYQNFPQRLSLKHVTGFMRQVGHHRGICPLVIVVRNIVYVSSGYKGQSGYGHLPSGQNGQRDIVYLSSGCKG